MSAEKIACTQFNRHAWKKDICTNCSKHLSCHNGEDASSAVSLKVKSVQAENKGSQNEYANESTKPGSQHAKPNKPKKPVFTSQTSVPKSFPAGVKTGVIKTENDEKACSNQNLKIIPNVDQTKSNSNYYQIYDIAAKGQSGKPVDLDLNEDDSASEKDGDASGGCLMATPYTVVDVITMAHGKSRNLPQAPGSAPPQLPSTPAPDLNRRSQTAKRNSGLGKKEETKSSFEKSVDDDELESFNSLSPHHYRPRLYEEIDESFLERVASKKLESKSFSEESANLLPVESGQPLQPATVDVVGAKPVEIPSNKQAEPNQKAISRQDKSKKSGGKSFFQKLLGKGGKDEDVPSSKADKNGKKESSVDDKSVTSIEDEGKRSSESLMDVQAKKEPEVPEHANLPEEMTQSSCISEDFAKEIEEKFETLTRKSNLCKIGPMTRSVNNKVDRPSDSPKMVPVAPLELAPLLDGGLATLPSRKSVVLASPGLKKKDSSINRKSMTPAEAKLARKMLVAPPPPPPTCSSSSLTSSSSRSASKDDISSTPNKQLTSFVSLQRKPDANCNAGLAGSSRSPGEDVFESPQMMPRDSLMDDLYEILKNSGMAHGAANTLPKYFIQNQEKTAGKSSMTTGRIPTKEATEPSCNNPLQQRALPDLPQLPPPTARLHKASLSPDGENLYEILPHSDGPSSPAKTGASIDESKLEKLVSDSLVKSTDIGNAVRNCKPDSESARAPGRPRPAPRAAIRSVGTLKAKDAVKHKTPEDAYSNADGAGMSKSLSFGLKLNEAAEERYSIISGLTLKSLQIYLEKFHSQSPLISLPSLVLPKPNWKQLEVDIIKAAESRTSTLSWMRAVFYEVVISSTISCTLMVRLASAMSSPFPKYNHQNLISSLHSFEAPAELPDCQRFFQTESGRKDANQKKSKYIFDVLPYSRVSLFASFPCHASNSSCVEIPSSVCDVSKWKVYTLLQIFDSLLHLQRLGIDLSRLHPTDVLLASCLQNLPSARQNAAPSRLAVGPMFPVLAPTEYGEHSTKSEQKLCHDLSKITALIVGATRSPTRSPEDKQPEASQRGGNGVDACQPRPGVQAPQPRARQTSISLDKNDRCLRKVERILSTGNSRLQLETARNYLELCLWGPGSEEEVRMALASPQRREIFEWWLSASRAETLTNLMESPTATKIPLETAASPSKVTSKNASVVQDKGVDKVDAIKTSQDSTCHTALETLRRAEFLGRLDLGTLLDVAKGLYF